MLKNLIGTIWERLPARVRRWTMRATNTRFTVTAAGIIFNTGGEILLLKHRFRAGSGWGIPGGFLKTGEQAAAALKRELQEEVNLELENTRLFTVRTFERQNQIEVVFVARSAGDIGRKSMEIERATWFRTDALPNGLPSDQKKLIESVLADGAKGRG